MSYYSTCNIEFKKEYVADLLPEISGMADCFIVGYVTEKTIVIQFNGRRYDSSPDWLALVGRASDLEEERDEEIFHTMTYDEFGIEDCGTFYDGVAYIDLCVDNYQTKYIQFEAFFKALGALE